MTLQWQPMFLAGKGGNKRARHSLVAHVCNFSVIQCRCQHGQIFYDSIAFFAQWFPRPRSHHHLHHPRQDCRKSRKTIFYQVMKIADHYWVIGPLDWILRQSQNLQPAVSVRFARRTLVCQRIVLQTSISTSVSQFQILKSSHGRGQIFCQASRPCPTVALLRNLVGKMKSQEAQLSLKQFFFHIYVYLHLKYNCNIDIYIYILHVHLFNPWTI